ncbi:transient receptor potential cation channel subfamily M member 3-like isoform X5 [Biomphalaria glabrata]|uniref:Transient receptor potential cation channel subfamily M member 3-like isoform X5 n=1 Tax=Biomphalaria glabrata TaxID=6526 RepID=A0A9W3ART0_BIOGL|nr:transient receptor potential cation channel subfamily M member 3-like isoform X5 [Biomphalaria glabrata]
MPHRRSQERHANRKKRLSADLANIQYISSSCQHSPVYENSRIFTVGTRLSRSLPSSPIRSMSSPNLWSTAAAGMASSRTLIPKKGSRTSLTSLPAEFHSLNRQVSQRSWVERTFHRRECIKFIPSHRDHSRCACGRNEQWHIQTGASRLEPGQIEKWHPYKHTEQRVTDAYGTIEFQGGPHPSKAQYMKLSSLDTRQENVLTLLLKHWGLDLPKLLITVHGGILNFDLQPKLKRVFRKGLLKAARTTGAWIVTNGTNTGVTRHVGDAISDRTTKARNKVVAIGIAPWGIVENKEDLLGRDIVVPYHCVSSTKTNTSVLNSNHSYFLLVDNGTVGKYGGEILFRKKFEKYIAQQKICIANDFRGHGVPVICVVLEGGANTIRSVLEYVTDTPPVPVVVCDGSGRAADLLAFAHKYTMDDGTMAESLRDQLILTIQRTFMYTQEQAEKLFIELMLCVKKKELITVFRMGDREESKDIDLAILTALLKGTTANAIDQLNLALTWDRVDIARSHIFVYGQEWPEGALEVAMMDALINDRVDFVKLLLENGVSMHTFLTIPRLEDLYNSRQSPSNTLRYLVRDVKKHVPSNYRYTLPDIGLVLQHLMGGGFRAYYCRKRFRQKYHALKQTISYADFKGTSVGNIVTSIPHLMNTKQAEELFPYPFHDLMIWAVLMKRQKMALFMWQHGEEALAKALLAGKLYAAMAHEADQDDLEIELSEEFRHYADEFLGLALELLGHCYKIDDDYTQQLLTYELKNFSEQTCLGLAVIANHRQFIAHTCCQVLLNDLWIGGLRMRKNTSLKVILGIIFPPYLFALDFKSKEELQLMPQTMEEHLDELEDAASVANISMSSFSEDQDYNYNEDVADPISAMNQQSPLKENGTLGSMDGSNSAVDNTIFSHMPFRKKKSPLRMGKKVYEFYNAPITKFWAHAIGYVVFLVIYCYVILDRLKQIPTWTELYTIAFIFTMGLEKIRQIIASEPVNISMKLRVYISQLWNLLDTIGIALFSIGVILRFIPSTLIDAQIIYSVDVIFWNIRMLEIFSVNKYLGPYVKIMGKLLRDMCYFLTILFIAVTSFGVVRQTVHFQNKDVSWRLRLRNVWYYPYWMIYGELFAEEIDPCLDETATDYATHCNIYASWLAPAFMCIFLLVANILMVNLLIARFNATFIRNNANSKEIWMFQRYGLILQYEMRPILPPPFIIFTHIYLAFKYIKRRCKGKRDFYDNGLKLFLSHEDTEKLHDFEEECMEDLYREKELKHQNSSEERIKFISERVENMSLRLDDMNVKENHLRLSLSSLDHRMNRIDDLENSLDEAIRIIKLMSSKEVHGSQESLDDLPSHLHPPVYSSNSSIDGSSLHPRTYSLGSSDVGDRNAPSPMLVHSKKKTLADQLKKFTSNVRRRQLSGSDFPLDETDQFVGENVDKELLAATRNNVRFLIGLTNISNSNNSGENKPELINLNSTDQEEPSTHKQKMKNFASQAVRFVEPVVHAAYNQNERLHTLFKQPSIDVTSKLDSDTYTTTQLPEYSNSVSEANVELSPAQDEIPMTTESPILPAPSTTIGLISRKGRSSLTNQPLTLNTALANASFIPCSMPQSSACFTASNSEGLPPAAVRDLTSMFAPMIGEYTSITDNIDTSCLMDCSPPCSPASNSAMFADNYHEMDAKLKDRSAASSKQLELKQAEEMEHQRMESLIRHRLRQISQDESGSISDIAKVVVAELAAESAKQTTLEEESEVSALAEAEEEAELEEHFGTVEQRKSSFGVESLRKFTSGPEPAALKQLSDIEDEVTTETLFLFRDRVRIQISQPSQDTGDTQSVSKFPC